MYLLYKMNWLRQERPAFFAQASRFVTAKEYVFQKLTGQQVVDYVVASGSRLLNVHTLQWNARSLAIAGIRGNSLAPLSRPLTKFRGIDATLAQAMGIAPQTLVVLGASEAANSTVGAGAAEPWQATCMIGNSGAFRVVAPLPSLRSHTQQDQRVIHYAAVGEGRWVN